MSEILAVYSPQQIVELMRGKMIADGQPITNFNQGSVMLSELEAFALVEFTTGASYKAALERAFPVAFFNGLGFAQKGAIAATGFFRFYRIPLFTMNYIGPGTSCLLTINPTTLSTTTAGGDPGDDLSLTLASYPTVQDLVDAINAHPNYTSVAVRGSSPLTLYPYTATEIVGRTDYLLNAGIGVLTDTSTSSLIATGTTVRVDNYNYQVSTDYTLDAGDDSIEGVAAICTTTGSATNLVVHAVDTFNGKGSLITSIPGIEHVINDVAFSGGQDAETADQRLIRFQLEVAGIIPGSKYTIESQIAKLDFIRSVTLLTNYPTAGFNTIVADRGDGTLTVDDILELQKIVEGDPLDQVNYPGVGVAGITYNYQAPNVQAVSLTLTVYRIGSATDPDDIKNNVATAITDYINSLRLGDDVVLSEAISRAKRSHSAIYDVVITSHSANIPTPSDYVSRSTTAPTVTLVTLSTVP